MSVQTPVSTKYNAYRNNKLIYNLKRKIQPQKKKKIMSIY